MLLILIIYLIKSFKNLLIFFFIAFLDTIKGIFKILNLLILLLEYIGYYKSRKVSNLNFTAI